MNGLFTHFQQGFASGFITGAAFVLVFYIAWGVIGRAVEQARARRERLTETTRFRRTGWLALTEHNEHENVDRLFGVKK